MVVKSNVVFIKSGLLPLGEATIRVCIIIVVGIIFVIILAQRVIKLRTVYNSLTVAVMSQNGREIDA